MISNSKRSMAVILFVTLIIVLVNMAWWLFYIETEKSFEKQLSRRLSSLAVLGAFNFSPDLLILLNDGDISAYSSVLGIIENIQAADDLSEIFIIDADYNYLATTSMETDSTYLLSALNGSYIDSALNQFSDLKPIVTEGYQIEDIVLKSAFMPLIDT